MASRSSIKRSNGPHEVSIGLGPEDREHIAGILRKLLADEYVLYTKTRVFHWDVTGPHFQGLHQLFEQQYEQLNLDIDAIAERMRALGMRTGAGLSGFLDDAELQDAQGGLGWHDMVRSLVEDHEALVRGLRDAIPGCEKVGDQGTTDFLTGLLGQHEKTAWMLRAHLDA